MIYAFKCSNGHTKDVHRAAGDTHCPICVCGETMVRDYRTEWKSQAVVIPPYMSSRNTTQKSDFLPEAKDFESPDDPTGENGMKEWKDTHEPTNKKAWV